MLHKWIFVLNTTKKVCKEENENDEVKKCRYKKTHTHLHVSAWMINANKLYALPILPLNCFHFISSLQIIFIQYRIRIWTERFIELWSWIEFRLIQLSLSSFEFEANLCNRQCASIRSQFCARKEQKPFKLCETVLCAHMIANTWTIERY